MKKLIFILLIVLLIPSCTNSKENIPPKTDGTASVTGQISNHIELQRNIFVGEIKAVAKEKALITKYNIDITEYTVYKVEVTESIDGFTPTGEIEVYWLGTNTEFVTRCGLEKNNSYVLYAEPWVYGDKIVYLLSQYTVSFPKIDTAGMVTLEDSDGTLSDLGSKEEFVKEHYTEYEKYKSANPDFFTPENTLTRFVDIYKSVYDKNSDTSIYENEMYSWTPDDEHIKATADKSKEIYDALIALRSDTDITSDKIKEIVK